MKKKGFTLIELLAVIVILAVIALIATPIVMNTIENSKKGAAERSADNYMDAVETAVAEERIDGVVLEGEYTIQPDGSLCPVAGCGEDDKDKVSIEMSGNKPSSGTIKIANGLVTTDSTMVFADGYTVSYDSNKGAYVAEKEESGANTTTTVYRWSTVSKSINDTLDPSDYTTDLTALGKNHYLKHVIDSDNKVIESYICAIFNNEPICLRGGSPEFYGYAENVEDYTGNILTLNELNDLGFVGFISDETSDSTSPDGSISFYAMPNGDVSMTVNGNSSCSVTANDGSNCQSW